MATGGHPSTALGEATPGRVMISLTSNDKRVREALGGLWRGHGVRQWPLAALPPPAPSTSHFGGDYGGGVKYENTEAEGAAGTTLEGGRLGGWGLRTICLTTRLPSLTSPRPRATSTLTHRRVQGSDVEEERLPLER